MSSPVVAPVVPAPAPQRPAGVVFAAIVLALMTCMGLFGALSVFLTAAFIHTAQSEQLPLIGEIQVVIGIVMLILCGLSGWTVIGLFRMKSWARVGIVVIGGVVTFFSMIAAVSFFALSFAGSFVPPEDTSGASPAMMKVMFLAIAGFYFLVGLVGVWWLVYFNLRRVRAAFSSNGGRVLPELAFQGPAHAPAELVAPSGGVWIDPSRPRKGAIEILVMCLAGLYLLGALYGIAEVFIRFPIFLFGYTLRGNAASIVGFALAVIEVAMGVGLLRRMKPAWVTALLFNGIGTLYPLSMLIPRYRAALVDYEVELMQHMVPTMSRMAAPPPGQLDMTAMFGPMFVISGIIGMVVAVLVFWLLIKAKPLFEARAS